MSNLIILFPSECSNPQGYMVLGLSPSLPKECRLRLRDLHRLHREYVVLIHVFIKQPLVNNNELILVSFTRISRNADLFRLPATLFLYRLILCQYVKELFSVEQSQSISFCPLFHPLCKDYLLSHPLYHRMPDSPNLLSNYSY